jgi:hypothetical protein
MLILQGEISMRTGFAQLPLHNGKAPRWLFSRMVKLSREIISYIIAEYTPEEILYRFSDPFWFQAFGCVLGFDWHSSGVTTTTCGAVKEGIKGIEKNLGLFVAGGKGAASRKTPQEITEKCEAISCDPSKLIYSSRISAKVDNAGLQDGYNLYHHTFIFTESGNWCVVQQGMHEIYRKARRYHWLGEAVENFVCEPHSAICCDKKGETLNLIAKESEKVRKISTQLSNLPPYKTVPLIKRIPELILPGRHEISYEDINPKYIEKILLKTYENNPQNFENLLATKGVGPKTLRALSLVSELIYGEKASTEDPARFSFAHGGKDGTPYPVDRSTYDKTIKILHSALEKSKIDHSEKVRAFKRLSNSLPY